MTNDKGEQVSEKLEKQIKKDPTGIDYDEFFRNAFYGVSYTDYLFSLPMGAGKTYLMAAFLFTWIYILLITSQQIRHLHITLSYLHHQV